MGLQSLVFLVPLILLAISIPDVYAQHHGGQQAPPISFGDGQVTVDTSINPSDFIPGKDLSTNLKIRFFDASSGFNVPSVTYRVQIFQGDQLLANQMYFDADGELDIKIQPNSNCNEDDLWRCTSYEGEKDPIVPNAFASTDTSRPVMKGPIFNKSGTYTVKVAIIGATNPKTQTTQDINFETNIMIAHEESMSLGISSGSVPILVRDFQQKNPSIHFDESSKSISMEMPFAWEHAEHTSMIRNEISVPKTFSQFDDVTSFSGYVNGIQVFPKDLHFDKTSDSTYNVIHIMIDNEELQSIKKKITNSNNFSLVMVPDSQEFVKLMDIKFDNGYTALASVDTRLSDSKDSVLSVSFFDSAGNLAKDARYAFSIKDPSGKESVVMGGNQNKIGLKLPSGSDIQTIATPLEGKYTAQIVLIGVGYDDFKNYMYRGFDFEMKKFTESASPIISKSDSIETPSAVPVWIKNNAKWWAEGQVDDNSFVQGIQYLIKQKVIAISKTQSGPSSDEIPSWVKNNAKWWADGKISENDFLKGIEYLASIGIIRTE